MNGLNCHSQNKKSYQSVIKNRTIFSVRKMLNKNDKIYPIFSSRHKSQKANFTIAILTEFCPVSTNLLLESARAGAGGECWSHVSALVVAAVSLAERAPSRIAPRVDRGVARSTQCEGRSPPRPIAVGRALTGFASDTSAPANGYS